MQIGSDNVQFNQFVAIQLALQLVKQVPRSAADSLVVGLVPREARAFQPRDDLLAALEGDGPSVPVVRALTGMRGVGKTQLAAACARSCIDAEWRLVAWIRGEEHTQVLTGLADVAVAMGIEEPGADLRSQALAVRRRLEEDGDRCLVVFDDVADLGCLQELLPSAGRCRVVITSNHAQALELGLSVPVGVFTEAEALAFLRERTGLSDDAGAAEVARELGCLPLGLAQAAAVIAVQRLDYPTYLARLSDMPVQVYLKQVTVDPYPRGVGEAIVLALDAAAEADPTGLRHGLISLIALLSAQGVSRSLLYEAGELGMLRQSGSQTAVGPTDVDQEVGELVSASLLTFSVDGSSVAGHPLTMRVVRERALDRQRAGRDDSMTRLAVGAVKLLSDITESLPDAWQNRRAARDAVSQILDLHKHLVPFPGQHDNALATDMLRLRGWAMQCLNQLGDSSTQIIDHGPRLVDDCERLLGSDHPETLGARGCLTEAYYLAGQLAQPVSSHERHLADCERALGPDHPQTLTARNNLAYVYEDAGRLVEASQLYEQTLADRERVLGRDDPHTLESRNNLAHAYQEAGQLAEAISMFERSLADHARILGPEHLHTLGARNNLARAFQGAGRLAEAISMFEASLSEHVRVLGPDHPSSLQLQHNVAGAYHEAGLLSKAIPLYKVALANRVRVLGDAHPATLQSSRKLGLAYQAAGQLTEAISMLESTLERRIRFLGNDHIDTEQSRSDLALAYQMAGRTNPANSGS
jgi:tetratricopeptide (TPR) repeat protein